MTVGETELVISPYAYCWFADGQGLCADGAPPEVLPSLTMGDDSALAVTFPLDWQLQATLFPDGGSCEGAPVIDVDPGGALLEALGPADTYLVEVVGRGEEGDGAWAFEVVTTTDRSMPPPFVQVFWNPGQGDLQPDTPFSAQIGNLPERPSAASAAVTVTASNDASQGFGLVVGDDAGCWSSTIAAQGPADLTTQILNLGAPPYSVVLEVVVDGQTLVGRPIQWPDDFPPDSNESRRTTADPTP